MRLGVLATHPIQYHAPLYRALAAELDLAVYFAHQQTAEGQADAGFGVPFEWDVPLLDGYPHTFLRNRAAQPDVSTPFGCHTPDIADLIARERFDAFLVNGWYNRSFWQAIRACWRTGTPILVRGDSQLHTPRSLAKRLAKEAVYRAFIPRFDGYLVVGQRAREYYLHYGARPERMHFVPHFVDNAFFAASASAARRRAGRAARREERGVTPEASVLLFAGKFIPVKRPLDFVRGVAALARRVPDVEGAMVGEGPMRAEIEAEIERTGAPVRLLGFFNQSEMPEAYALADVLVLPSETETWGLVVNEALACGLPAVVSSGVGCAPDLVEPGATGGTYPMGDVDALAVAMERALHLARDPAAARALKARMETYSLETAVSGTLGAVRAVRPL
ncbi:MAG: glycosyltransferase family 4 protein [Rhodothermales bacterium]